MPLPASIVRAIEKRLRAELARQSNENQFLVAKARLRAAESAERLLTATGAAAPAGPPRRRRQASAAVVSPPVPSPNSRNPDNAIAELRRAYADEIRFKALWEEISTASDKGLAETRKCIFILLENISELTERELSFLRSILEYSFYRIHNSSIVPIEDDIDEFITKMSVQYSLSIPDKEAAFLGIALALGLPIETAHGVPSTQRSQWIARKGKSGEGEDSHMSPPDFIKKHYAAEIETGTLTQAMVRREDRKLYDAFHNWRRKNKTPLGFDFPQAYQPRDARYDERYGEEGADLLHQQREVERRRSKLERKLVKRER